jgi:Transglycosylase SLT domain
VARISVLPGVRAVLAVDGGQVTINGRRASILGVPPQAFRSWTPPVTAADATIWASLDSGQLIVSSAAVSRLALAAGNAYQVSADTQEQVRLGATALLDMPSVDAIVSTARAAQLGLATNIAVLVNAPAADLATLMQRVRSVTGAAGTVASLVPVATAASLPVDTDSPAGRPANYLQLYQESAAQYCPGLSWTVLAAIGEIESDDGANDGPSTSGALGPMQFLPSTWRIWGTDAFGQAGPPDIMNPLDAVPSAARMLCANGAAAGAAALSTAIFDYNHATWYVTEVLDLASEYAQEYS